MPLILFITMRQLKLKRISNRNRAFWWFLFLYFYSVIDAYIDPEMESFPKDEMQNEEVK